MGVLAAMARMDPVPGGKIASNCCTPNIPRLEMVKVPAMKEEREGGRVRVDGVRVRVVELLGSGSGVLGSG